MEIKFGVDSISTVDCVDMPLKHTLVLSNR